MLCFFSNFKNATNAGAYPLDPRLQINCRAERPKQLRYVRIERNQPPNRECSVDHFVAAVSKNGSASNDDDKHRRCAEPDLRKTLLHARLCPFGRQTGEFSTVKSSPVQQLQLNKAKQ